MFTEELWQSWISQESNNYQIRNGKRKYLKKGYLHFDHRFWFPEKKEELKSILVNGLRVYKKGIQRSEYWSFKPFLKILMKTPRYRYQESENSYELDTKVRPICFASHIDSLIFGFYSHCISKEYEKYIKLNHFDECVLAYRSDLGLSNIQFAKEVFNRIKSKGECTCIALDIKGYFDHIDHGILKEKWKKVLSVSELPEDQYRVFKSLTRYNYVNKESIYKTLEYKKKRGHTEPKSLLEIVPGEKDYKKFALLNEKKLIVTNNTLNKETNRPIGIPQGSAMSALLSNIYLIDFDKLISNKAIEEGFIYRRYCDDILIICDTDKAKEVQNFAIAKINSDYYLTIQPKKVEIIDFQYNSKNVIRAFKRDKKNLNSPVSVNVNNEQRFYKSLQYLGFEYNGCKIFIRSSSLSRYFRKLKARIVKTVSMAYSPKSKSEKIFKKQLYDRYSFKGERNFISYALKAAGEKYKNSKGDWVEGMNSLSIKKQISRHFAIITLTLKKKNEQRFNYKILRNKKIKKKKI